MKVVKILALIIFLSPLMGYYEYDDLFRKAGEFVETIDGFKYEITPTALKALIEANADIVIIDLRPQKDFQKGHIPHAINIPFKNLFSPGYINLIPHDKKIIIYCPDESLSPYILTLLRLSGFDAWQLKGGYRGWKTGVSLAYTSSPHVNKPNPQKSVKKPAGLFENSPHLASPHAKRGGRQLCIICRVNDRSPS